jgi:hypothetical protein
MRFCVFVTRRNLERGTEEHNDALRDVGSVAKRNDTELIAKEQRKGANPL